MVVTSSVNETLITERDPVRFALAAAEAKAKDVGTQFPQSTVIGADTIVVLHDTILGKPSGIENARAMLHTLSGTTHLVITALALYAHDENKLLLTYQTSAVTFKKLTHEMIETYLARGDFDDKAGSYAIQNVGDTFVSAAEGDYDNIIGLPVETLRKLLEAFMTPLLTLDIIDIALPDGYGVAKHEGGVIFIPQAVTGDTIAATIVKEKPRLAYAHMIGLTALSASRVTATCPHSGICGGCILQELNYPEQLRLKDRHLYQTLGRIGKIDTSRVQKIPITPSRHQYFYRNKIELSFSTRQEKAILGFKERASGAPNQEAIIPVSQCPIANPRVPEIISRVLEFADAADLAAYNPHKKEGVLKRLIIKEAKASGKLMVILVTKQAAVTRYAQRLHEALSSIEPIESLCWAIEERDDTRSFEQKILIAGENCIRERIGDFSCNVYPETFLQANSETAPRLYEHIKQHLGHDEKILSLYCGSGLLELSIAHASQEITGIDTNANNISCARENCQLNNITNCNFSPGKAEEALKKKRERDCNTLILDPPRSGLSPEALRRVCSYGAAKILYVSCNPASLARDIAILAKPYHLASVAAFDMFPQTGHLEIVAILRKKQ